MAKKSSRTRAQRKRADYRKGGRVGYRYGGEGDTEGMFIEEDPNLNIDTATTTTPTYTQADVDKAYADLNSGAVTATLQLAAYSCTVTELLMKTMLIQT
jgi:hypothetical protein